VVQSTSFLKSKPQRIMIFGRSGSGKSTTALLLSKSLGLPVHHLDKYFYIDGWQERNYQDFLHIQQKIVNQDHWIFDGNGTQSLEMRYQRADVAIYFYYPFWQCIWRAFKRTIIPKNPSIDDRAPNCPEIFSWKLFKYIWSFDDRVRDNLISLTKKYPTVTFFKVTNDRELAHLLTLLS
jgi:adenylate kinase family enzyme